MSLYSEKSIHQPINNYVYLKSQADKYLRNNLQRLTLLRPITIFGELLGVKRNNPFSLFFDLIRKNQDIISVNDIYINIFHNDTLIECIAKVIDEDICDEFNISGDNIVSRYDFALELKRLLPDIVSVIIETESSGFKTAARGPLNALFDNQKMKSQLGVYPIDISMAIEQLINYK